MSEWGCGRVAVVAVLFQSHVTVHKGKHIENSVKLASW